MTAPLVTPSRDALANALCDAAPQIGTESAEDWFVMFADALLASGVVAAADTLADDEALVERLGREAFWTDDVGGHHKPGARPHTWENIPEIGRENYRTLIRAVLREFAAAPVGAR